jgi:hypothetical protein
MPSGLNAMDKISPEFARGGPIGRLVPASHSRTWPSLLPVRIVMPLELNATNPTPP